MAESATAIVNAGLTYIGHTQFVDDLEDTNDDSTERALAVESFDTDRRFVLRAFDWPCATMRVRPAQLDPTTLALGAVPGGWTYAFARPTDALKIRAIFQGVRNPREDQRTRYAIERDGVLKIRVILTDYSAPEIVYTGDLDDVSQFDADLDDAMAWKLAIKFAAGLNKSVDKIKLAATGYAQAIALAAANAAGEGQADPTPTPDWLAVR